MNKCIFKNPCLVFISVGKRDLEFIKAGYQWLEFLLDWLNYKG